MIQQYFNDLEKHFDVESLSHIYEEGKPVKHLIVDNFLPGDIYNDLCYEIETYPEEKWITKQLDYSGARKESRDFTGSPTVHSFMNMLTEHHFVSWLGKITNCESVIPDPHHLGAGVSVAPSGAYLGLHVDFNWNNTLRLNRKFNLILYANREWKPEWNGQLEFWTKDKEELMLSIEPKPNRLVFWEYEEEYLHGFSKPLACPENVQRQNLMTVYYTSNASPSSDPHKSLFS
jgi:Rps23 Pro-64 3,4-dihydroxylase Tpa1-like proline 4-hydroxylase